MFDTDRFMTDQEETLTDRLEGMEAAVYTAILMLSAQPHRSNPETVRTIQSVIEHLNYAIDLANES